MLGQKPSSTYIVPAEHCLEGSEAWRDKHELLILPNPGDSSIVLSETTSALAARGRKDASSLKVRKSEPRYLARVGCIRRRRSFEGGKLIPQVIHYGLIGTAGESIVEPVHNQILPFSCGLAAFSVRPLLRRSHADVREEMFNPYHGLWGYLDSDWKSYYRPPIRAR